MKKLFLSLITLLFIPTIIVTVISLGGSVLFLIMGLLKLFGVLNFVSWNVILFPVYSLLISITLFVIMYLISPSLTKELLKERKKLK